jgi:membrane associated rhomboid family serine protease
MDGSGQVSFAFPRPGRALWAVLIGIGGFNIVLSLLAHYAPQIGEPILKLLVCAPGEVFPQLWRLVTSGLLTNPASLQHLIFTLLGLYFLSPSLEKSWGAARFLVFLALSVVVGNLLVLAVWQIAPENAGMAFHPPFMLGASAALAGIAVAWSRENSEVQARFFFLIPVRGKYLLWLTIAFCVLGLVFQEQLPEGMVAPFGGVITGMLLSGSPSVVRTLYLRTKLFFLRRRRGTLRIEDVLSPPRPTPSAKRARPGAPPLRVVQGGLDDVLKNRKPPKDKRYLN